jgi:hypothetical protein
MGFEAAQQLPARMAIYNLATSDSIEAQFNPTELEEQLDVNWARLTVPGLSHQPLQFVHTGNVKFALELRFDALDARSSLEQILLARRFLQSLCYPRRNAQNVAEGGAARTLFVWPNIISLSCVITTLSFKYIRFNIEGTPVVYTVKVGLEEIRDVRLVAEDVLSGGSRRNTTVPESA